MEEEELDSFPQYKEDDMRDIWKWTMVLLLGVMNAELEAQGPGGSESLCDPGLMGSSNSPAAYRLRGDRCEGRYALQVNSTHIRLASMVEAFGYDPSDGTSLRIAWDRDGTNGDAVRLRAQSLRPKTYYRMDTEVSAPDSSYEWPPDVLGAIGLLSDEVGILGWTSFDNEADKVYLPLNVSQSKSPKGANEYQVGIVPEHRLLNVFITLTPIDNQGEAGSPLFEKRPLEDGYYPAKQATVFYIDKPRTIGLYEVGIDCTIMGGGSISTSFRFYHAGDEE